MPRVPLTDRFCSTAKSIATQTDYFDAIVPGLALRVAESGRRTLVLSVHLAARRQTGTGNDRHLPGYSARRSARESW
jgi:hypothetical protein